MDLLEQLNALPGQLEERLAQTATEAELEAVRVDFLGRKGKVPEKLAIPMNKLRRFFPGDATPRRMEEEILGLLEQREKKRRRERQMER